MPCMRCGQVQTDPVKGASPWARLVVKGRQGLLCPECQSGDPLWKKQADTCPNCGSLRLAVMLDVVVCRDCASDFERSLFEV